MKKKISVGLNEAEYLSGIGSSSLRRMALAGKIRSARVGRKILIPVSEIERLIRAGGAPVPSRESEK